MRLKKENNVVIINLNQLEKHVNINLKLQSKRADLKIKKGYVGTIIVKNIDDRHHLSNIEIADNCDVEIIAFTKYKKSGDYSTILKLKKDSKCRYNSLSNTTVNSNLKMVAKVNENAHLDLAVIDFDKASKSNEYACYLQGKGASVDFNLATIASQNERKKFIIKTFNLTETTHAMMHNRGLVFKNGNLTIEGVGDVAHHAKEATNEQHSHILLSGNEARATCLPLLLIKENDIQASHAMTMGKIDEDILFYMLSRGLSEEQARYQVMMGAFKPVIDKISDNKIKAKMLKYLQGVI